jgi:hypothetical protein
VEMVAWGVLGLTTVVCGLLARRHDRARVVGAWAVGVLFLLAGALVNLIYLLRGTDYGGFADASYIPFVRETWLSVVAPRQGLFIGLLIVFEAAVGLLVLSGGRRRQWGYAAIIGFHVALLSFGWFFYAWTVPMIAALWLLLRAERAAASATSPAAAELRPLSV